VHLNKIFDLVSKEILKTKSVARSVAGVCALIGILQFGLHELSSKIVSQGPVFLTHKFPVVRKSFIDKLYFYLMMSGEEVLGANLNDKLNALLTENDWFEMQANTLKDMRDQVDKTFEEMKTTFLSANSE